ncbi:ribonuclease H-like domain-containing protein [Tanacetum coccineum]
MDLETAQTTTTAKLPILKQGEYDMLRLRNEQYFQVQDYALWDVIENGNSFKPATQTTTNADGTSTSQIPGPVTTEEKIQKKNDVNARSMLLITLPNEHLMTFNQYKDAKTLFAAIQTRFSGNEATKKTQKTLLKQIHILVVQKDNTAYRVSTDNTQVSPTSTQFSTASTQVSTANLSDATVYAFLANQPNGYQLVHEDLEQIREDDLEEMDLKWQSQSPRENQRNWNNQKSQQLGSQIHSSVNAVRANQVHPQKEDQGYVDSRCSRHIIGNMSYLSDFKEFDGGYDLRIKYAAKEVDRTASDYECRSNTHPDKANNGGADALSRKEILKGQTDLRGLETHFEQRDNGEIYFFDRIWIPSVGDVRKLIMDEAHTSRYSVHPGADKMYYDLRELVLWPGMKRDNYYKTEKLAKIYVNEIVRDRCAMSNISTVIFNLRHTYATLQEAGTRIDIEYGFPPSDRRSKWSETIQTLEDMLRACVMDFGAVWDTSSPLIEFSYNNSYHTSIKCAPFELCNEAEM